jgi:ABC-type transporter Mla MlaB component
LSKLSSQATLNISGVSRVNSVGISVWLDFTRQAS